MDFVISLCRSHDLASSRCRRDAGLIPVPEDRLLLCSDGLTTMVADDEALVIMASEDLPESVCRRLVDEANDNGGRDNITVIVAFFTASV